MGQSNYAAAAVTSALMPYNPPMKKTALSLVLAFAPLAAPVAADTAAEIFSLTEFSRLDGSGCLPAGGLSSLRSSRRFTSPTSTHRPAWCNGPVTTTLSGG